MRYLKSITSMVFLFVFTILTGVSCGGADDSLESVRLSLDWYPNANHIGLYVALEKGYFDEENIKLDMYTPSDPNNILQTVASGSDHFGINYQPDVLEARGAGAKVVSILGMVQHPLNSVMTLSESPYKTPSTLKGKKVGYPGLPFNGHALSTMLKSDGLSGVVEKDVDFVNVGWELGSSLISKKVDAVIGVYFTHESIALENQGYPVNVMRMEDWGVPDYYELVMVTSENYLKENPSVVERFTRAVSRGYADAIKDPAEGIEILKKHEPEIDVEVDGPGALLLQPLWQDKNGKFGGQTDQKWVEFADWMKNKGIIPKSLNVQDAYTDKYSLK